MKRSPPPAVERERVPPPSEEEVYEVLDYVYDPELEIDVVNLGLIYEVTIRGRDVTVLMTLTTMGCPAQEEIEANCIAAVSSLDGVDRVKVEWTFDPPWTPSMVTDDGRDMLQMLGYL